MNKLQFGIVMLLLAAVPALGGAQAADPSEGLRNLMSGNFVFL
jgi:hypothetical protein